MRDAIVKGTGVGRTSSVAACYSRDELPLEDARERAATTQEQLYCCCSSRRAASPQGPRAAATMSSATVLHLPDWRLGSALGPRSTLAATPPKSATPPPPPPPLRRRRRRPRPSRWQRAAVPVRHARELLRRQHLRTASCGDPGDDPDGQRQGTSAAAPPPPPASAEDFP